ncbi:MAG: hypothetical protein MH472_05135 [Bacteroidia bacterium]|nr:hypothetical protein [Bacteroidia bacterium]
MYKSLSKLFLFLFVLSFFWSCSNEKVTIQLFRFEKELFDEKSLASPQHFLLLQNKYGPFYQTFAQDMLSISEEEQSQAYQPSLSKFVVYPTIKQLKWEVDSVFPSLQDFEEQLSESMTRFHNEFPKDKIPAFVTFISEFGYAHVNLDTVVGIGLDMYLGEKYTLYPALDFPDFLIAKLRKEYMLNNTLKSLAIGKYEYQLKDKRFLAMMLFEGKVRYFIKELAPQIQDTILLGYSQNQLNWARENEGMIWAHFLEKKMLFNQEPGQYLRYINDGPFTIANGVPQESSPAIGVFSGYQIIKSYIDKTGASLQELMLEDNWDKILKESNYRPK